MRCVRVASTVVVLAALAYSPPPLAASSIEEQFKYGSIGSEDQEGLPY